MNLKKIRRIAVIRNQKVGDLIAALPVFEAIRQGLPQAHITAVVSPRVAPLLNRHPHVDSVLLDDHQDPPEQLTSLLRAGRFDAVLVTLCIPRNCLAALRARVPIRVTEGRHWLPALCGTHRCYVPLGYPFHVTTYLLSFTQRMGIPLTLEQARPYLYVDPAERAMIERRIAAKIGTQGPLFGMHPGSAGSAFNWPVENYFETIERLATVGRVVFTGGTTGGHFDQAFEELKSRLTPELSQRVMPLPDLTLTELVATLSLYDAFLGSSSGPLHIASIVSRSALGLVSELFDQHPKLWKPIGSNGKILAAKWNYSELPPIDLPLSERHMSQITVDMVVERMLESVEEKSFAA